MAFARVQVTPRAGGGGGTVSPTFTTPPTVGHGIVVFVAGRRTAINLSPTACTDNRGNAYTRAVLRTSSGGGMATAIYYCPVVGSSAAPFTVSVTTGLTTAWTACALEVSGVGAGLTVDQTVTNFGTAATVSTGATPALSTNNGLVAAVYAVSTPQASITIQAVSPPFTEEYEQLTSSATAVTGEADSRVLTGGAGTTASATWTAISTSVEWVAALVVFQGTGAAAAGPSTQPYIWLPV